MKTISTYNELFTAWQIARIWLFALRTLRLIWHCASFMILIRDLYRPSCTCNEVYQPRFHSKKLAVFRRRAVTTNTGKRPPCSRMTFFGALTLEAAVN